MSRMVQSLSLAGCLFLVAACSAGGGAPVTGAPPTGTPTSTASTAGAASPAAEATATTGGSATCTTGDVATSLRAAAAAQQAADSYRVTGSITGKTALQAVMEIQKPDRIHVKAGDMEFISVGGQTWRNVGGTWQAAPGVDVQSLVGGMGQLDAQLIEQATFANVSTKSGSANGLTAIEYDYHESIPDQLEADVQLWLDPATCRPIRNVASGGSSTFDVSYSDWNAVSVEVPE